MRAAAEREIVIQTPVMESAQLIEELGAAFRSTVRPPPTALVNDHCDECIDTYRLFWDVPHSFMTWESAAEREGTCIESALLSPEAWRYYLPAMLVWCVRDTNKVDVLLDNLVYELTPRVGRGSDWFEPRSRGFSAEQRGAIVSFLEWYQKREQAEWASIATDPPSSVSGALEYWRAAG